MSETPDLLAALQRSLDDAREARALRADSDQRRDVELRDHLAQLDDPATEEALHRLLADAPDLHRALLRQASIIDPDAVTDALNEAGVPLP